MNIDDELKEWERAFLDTIEHAAWEGFPKMAEIIQHYYKDDNIQFEIIVRSRSLKCNSAISDLQEFEEELIKDKLQIAASNIAPLIVYIPKD